MEDKVILKKVIHATREIVFQYWTDPVLLEKWATTRNLKLQIPQFDPRTNGEYIYEHLSDSGPFICKGRFVEFIPNNRITLEDHITAPDRKIIFDKLRTSVSFTDDREGTLMTIMQSGHPDEDSRYFCEISLQETIERLVELIENMRFRPGQQLRAHQVRPG